MNVILLGAPGSGKGTQGAMLSARAGLPRIATGDLLRAAVRDDSDLGRRAKTFMDAGDLVPDEIIIDLIKEVLDAPQASGGVIMDGFPRTVAQAEAVDAALASRGTRVDRVITFSVPEDELVRRLLNRAAKEGRSDDTAKAVEQRLTVYRERTEPLLQFYRRRSVLQEIDGVGSVDDIAGRVMEALGA